MRVLVLLSILLLHLNGWAACPGFEASLQNTLSRFERSTSAKAKNIVENSTEKIAKQKALSSPAVIKYKERYSSDFKLPPKSNQEYIDLAKADAKAKRKDVLFFDVENSVQKNLNDNIFGEKTMVDSVNNSFMERFYQNVQNNPLLKSRMSGQYKDYKSLRLRLELKPGDSRAELEANLASIYQKSAKEFQVEFDKLKLHELVKPRTDEIPDVDRWFLAGSGDTPIAANMAARGARTNLDKGILHYADHIDELHKDVLLIESLRKGFSNEAHLLQMGVLDKLPGGQLIPSKDMISILRKVKPSACKDYDEYLLKIHEKMKQMFGKDISNESINNLTKYFTKVDSLSPPLFSAERVEINLGMAKQGIVSIDFTGVGVDNAYQQMSGLAKLNYAQTDKALMLKEAFGRVQSHVNKVTAEMKKSKEFFSDAVKKVGNETHEPMFSGDDGIFMPKFSEWSVEAKNKLIVALGKSEDPSKFRITFVKSHFSNGKEIPPETLSSHIVIAEKLEKAIREKLIGADSLTSAAGKKVITAIDFVPSEQGGSFKVIVGGKSLTTNEQKLIEDIAKKSIDSSAGEKFAGLEVVSGH